MLPIVNSLGLMLMQMIIAATRIIFSLFVLVYASWSDYKTREVSNRVWVIYAPIALFLSLAELLLYDVSKLPFFALSVGLTCVIALVLFYSGGFGGADSKALMCIALALPFFPEAIGTPALSSGISPLSQFIFPLVIFSNSVLFAAASGLYMLLHNIIWHLVKSRKIFEGTLSNESIGKKIIVLITGYRLPMSRLEEKWHIYPMEDIEDESEDLIKRRLVILPKDEGRDEIVKRLSNARNAGKIEDYVWVTPGLPMLIFVTLGLIVALSFGDIVWMLVSSILA